MSVVVSIYGDTNEMVGASVMKGNSEECYIEVDDHFELLIRSNTNTSLS